MRPETDVGSEIPLPSFNVTHRGLAASKLISSDNQLCTPTSHTETERQTDGDWERDRD